MLKEEYREKGKSPKNIIPQTPLLTSFWVSFFFLFALSTHTTRMYDAIVTFMLLCNLHFSHDDISESFPW